MSRPDWRDPAAYETLRALDAPGFAWEFLRRNPEFQRDRSKLERADSQGTLSKADEEAFTSRWGCKFTRAAKPDDPNSVYWATNSLPSAVALTKLPAGLADPRFMLPPLSFASDHNQDRGERILACRGVILRIHVEQACIDPPAVLLPLDRLFEIRAVAAVRLWRGLIGRSLGPDPAALSKMRRDRLLLGLRALDGRRENASYREIADILFGPVKLPPRQWKIDDLRSRTIRLVRFGSDVMQSGYRRLLLHPYRRRS
jgi:hypothetical protein